MKEFYLSGRTVRTPIQTFDVKLVHYVSRSKHTHNGLELTYVKSGSAIHTLYPADGSEPVVSEVSSGNYFVLTAGTSHSFSGGSPDFAVINLLAKPEAIDPRLTAESSGEEIEYVLLFGKESSLHVPFNTVLFDEDAQLVLIFDRILGIKARKPEGMLGFYRSYVMEILLTILNMSETHKRRKADNIAQTVKDYIDVYFSEPITLNEICERYHYARPYVSSRFRRAFGCTFEQYLQKARMSHARHLLLETDLSIEKISASLSYASTTPFRRTFEKHFGMTPTEYRKRNADKTQ